MSKPVQAAHQIEDAFLEDGAQDDTHPGDRARPIPRISIQAFCDDARVAEALQYAADDRRLAKTHVSVHMGGIAAAISHYVDSPTPNLIIVDSALRGSQIVSELDQLAESCDPGTKVIVIGRHNDVLLYRELLKRGVAEYLVTPVDPMGLMESISNLYNNPDTDPVGHVFAFIGAKGGVGSSTDLSQRRLDDVGSFENRCHDRRSRSRLRHDRARFQSGSGAGHRGSARGSGTARRPAARPSADEVFGASLDLRRSGRARPRLRYLGRCLRTGHRCRAPERSFRCR